MSSIAVASLAIQLVTISAEFWLHAKRYEKAAISRTYGTTLGWFIVTFAGDTAAEYERIQRVVLRGKDEETLRFRDSVMTECNMTAVAVRNSRLTIKHVVNVTAGRHYRPGRAHSAFPAEP